MDTGNPEEVIEVNTIPAVNSTNELANRNQSEQLFSRIRIGFILLFAGPALSTASVLYSFWKETTEYTLFYGLSIFGVIYLFQTIQFYFSIYDGEDSTTLGAISAWRKFIEAVLLVVFGLATAWFLHFYFVPPQDNNAEESFFNGVSALTERSSIMDWHEIGFESNVIRISFPYATTYEWAMYRQGLENEGPTKALIYTAINESGKDLYRVTIEWIYDEEGKKIFTPDLQKEAGYLKEFYGFENDATISDIEIQGIAMKKFILKSDNDKLAGVWFEHNNEYYEIVVWPEMPGKTEAELDKVLGSIKFAE